MNTFNNRTPDLPYMVSAVDELPASLLDLFRRQEKTVEPGAGIFVIPQQAISAGQRRPHKVPLQALIFTDDGVFHISNPVSTKSEGEVIWMPAGDILKIKLTMILLYGRLEIWGMNQEKHSCINAEYNTVSYEMMAPFLKQLIKKTWEKNPAKVSGVLLDDTASGMDRLSYSFSNGFKIRALQAGEQVQAVVSQPEIVAKKLKLFKQHVSPNTALAITTQQMIILEEGRTTNGKYAWIFTFCPAYRLSTLEQKDYRDWHKVKIHLSPTTAEDDIEVIMNSQHAREWQEAWLKVVAN